ncbi:MAG: tetratricopeptide repeat protein [Oscillospiraceae bacterium]|nr:tetratricopeptide repeat protein [Oscillospiraceae bacterium]
MDYPDPICCFDSTAYTGIPDAEPTGQRMNVPAMIRQLDQLIHAGRAGKAQNFLEKKRQEAVNLGDWRAELTILSEMMGQYRFGSKRQEGLDAVRDGLELVRLHHLGRTVSGATVLLNAATTMKHFGLARESLPVFQHVSRVYADNLDPTDYRFAGLYNNMALSYAELGDQEGAERCYRLALNVLAAGERQDNDMAVTLCSLAELYDSRDPLDERVGQCMEQAWEHLNGPELPHDGYHALTIRKCLPCFDRLGYFVYVKELKERLASIRDRT